MPIARRGTGPLAAVTALGSQVHPVFMLPAVATAAFGAVLAGDFSPSLAALHMGVVFCGLYVAHVKDGYVDFYRRGEDDDHPLTAAGCRVALAGATALFVAGVALLWVLAGPGAAVVSAPGWIIGYFHAPQLDTNPVTATSGYPLGVGLALVSGYYVQASALSPTVLAVAVVVVVILSGVKIIDDATDYEYDRSIDKRTVAVVLGRRRARTAAYAVMAAGLFGVAALALAGRFPPGSLVAVAAFGAVALVARRADARLATMLLIRGAYVFLAVLVVAVWFRPLA